MYKSLSKEIFQLLEAMLEKDPKKRISIEEIIQNEALDVAPEK